MSAFLCISFNTSILNLRYKFIISGHGDVNTADIGKKRGSAKLRVFVLTLDEDDLSHDVQQWEAHSEFLNDVQILEKNVCFCCLQFVAEATSLAKSSSIVGEAVEIETKFVCETLPRALIGTKATLMSEFIKFVSDSVS
ncbi:hypothetical protein DKX38_014944 [Salix brachista]|uniref:Uncharacterized protein n=1 Tax=Salix brachista TaxID=2182728 RepID=A0A5N5L5P0_9ROSI|nr:hypothetical protein DKX38_014944 [Salix brachista]